MNYCSNCGQKLNGANYCPNCGMKIKKDENVTGHVPPTPVQTNASNITNTSNISSTYNPSYNSTYISSQGNS